MNSFRKRPAIALACALGGLLALTACGDDNGGDPLTKAELISEANAICKRSNEELRQLAQERLQRSAEEASTEEVAQAYEEIVFPKLRQQLDAVAELTPPEDLKRRWDQFIAAFRADLADAEQAARADFERYEQDDKAFAATERSATDIGIEECAD